MSRQNKVFYQRPQQNATKSDASQIVHTKESERTFTIKEPVETGVKDWIRVATGVTL